MNGFRLHPHLQLDEAPSGEREALAGSARDVGNEFTSSFFKWSAVAGWISDRRMEVDKILKSKRKNVHVPALLTC